MERIESLGNQLSQITLYDIKSMYTQAKNVVLNVSEMEAKVRDATNDDPWGASSTLMQEIAQGTFNFQQFNEIMPCIYARYMEKEARQWRQIYKALQLLEYLVKNGSERVVDDARGHIGTIKMLRNFYYVDEKGKDQGVNVRNRSKEIVDLLSDVEKIRGERRKAKTNKSKYIGTGSDGGGGWGGSSGGSRYGGFGSDSVGSGSGGAGYGGGGAYDADGDGNYGGSYSGGTSSYSGGGGGRSGDGGAFRDDSGRNGFQEYDAGDDEAPRRSNSLSTATRSTTINQRSNTAPVAAAPPPKAKEPVKEVDLLGDDDFFGSAPATVPAPGIPPPVASVLDDDDFDDFQAAPPSAPPVNQFFAAPAAPVLTSTPPIQQSFMQPQQAPMQPNFYSNNTVLSPTSTGSAYTSPTSANYASGILSATSPPPRGNVISPGSVKPTPAPAAKPSGNFDDLWSMSLGTAAKPAAGTPAPAKSMKDLEKEKASAGIWGSSMQPQQGKTPAMGMGLGGSNMGGFGGASSNSGGFDDLLG